MRRATQALRRFKERTRRRLGLGHTPHAQTMAAKPILVTRGPRRAEVGTVVASGCWPRAPWKGSEQESEAPSVELE